MNKDQFSHTILDTLKTRNIVPRSAFRVWWKKISAVLIIIGGILVGAIAVTTAAFLILDHDWSIYGFLGRTFGNDIIHTIPYFWIGIIICAIGFVRLLQRTISRGYRIAPTTAIFGTVGAMAILGITFFSLGLNREVHDFISEHVPLYNRLVESNDTIWQHTEDGLIAGTLVEYDGSTITIRDSKHVEWEVIDQGAVYGPRAFPLSVGEKVKITGDIDSDTHRVYADTIERWSAF